MTVHVLRGNPPPPSPDGFSYSTLSTTLYCDYCGSGFGATHKSMQDDWRKTHRKSCEPGPVGLEREGWDIPPEAA
jgi:hypothetical protein